MYGFFLIISLLMILYGLIRFVVAKWRREEHPQVHVLWLPGAAFLFAFGVALCTWV